MESTLRDLRRWIQRHYAEAPNASMMTQIIETFATPLAALQLPSSSEWMQSDTRELLQLLRQPWSDILQSAPTRLTAENMEERLRQAVRLTRDQWKETMKLWIAQYNDDSEDFKVRDGDLRALQQMTESLSTLKVLHSPEHVQRRMDAVIEAAKARRERREQRKREHVAKRLAHVREEAADTQRELDARKQAAREKGLSLGRKERTREHVEVGMLASKKRRPSSNG